MACQCCSHGAHRTYVRSSLPRDAVTVMHGDRVARVELASLSVLVPAGRPRVPLSDLWRAASLAVDDADLRFGLLGDDGFDTRTKGGAPLRLLDLRHGFVDPATRDVGWRVVVPCFLGVKGLSTLVAVAA